MGNSSCERKRRTFRWSAEAKDLVNANPKATGNQLRQIVTQLVEMTGNPRSACRRFVCRMGNAAKIRYKKWPVSEQQRLLELLDKYSVAEASRVLRCSKRSIYAILRRLKLSARTRQDSFSESQLAAILHVRFYEVDSWIRKGWLKAKVIQIGQVGLTLIKPDDFVRFCVEYRDVVIGNRLNIERLEFVYKYVFPPDHNYLLSVRASKKERTGLGNSDSQDPQFDDGESDKNRASANIRNSGVSEAKGVRQEVVPPSSILPQEHPQDPSGTVLTSSTFSYLPTSCRVPRDHQDLSSETCL